MVLRDFYSLISVWKGERIVLASTQEKVTVNGVRVLLLLTQGLGLGIVRCPKPENPKPKV